ncbi:MAG: hypothetical protein EPO26_01000 [Chloroflexota bacterium]|nr:MAG: hypothetical protein EPO26_01000 [Chloroflexota bacterium]
MVDSRVAVGMWSLGRQTRAFRAFGAIVLLLAVIFGEPRDADAHQGVDDCGHFGREPRADEFTPTPFWETAYMLDTLRPTTATADGMSVFLLDQSIPALMRLPLNVNLDDAMHMCELPTPWDAAAPPRLLSQILIAPRAFYLLSTDAVSDVPSLFRADRYPTAIRGGWRRVRQMNGPATIGLSAVAQDATIFALRSGPAFEVDWQPIGSTGAESSVRGGATLKLSSSPRAPVGITVTRDTIYVFGGIGTETAVTRVPLKNRSPRTPEAAASLAYRRTGAVALVHDGYIYLVGGNDPGKPTIERSRQPLPDDPAKVLWEAMPEPPVEGGDINAAVFARGKFWLFRADGRVQTTQVASLAPGTALIRWDRFVRTTRVVRKGDTFTVDIPWQYTGPLPLSTINVDLKASALYTKDDRQDFATLAATSFPGVVLPATPRTDPVDGPTIQLNVRIPMDANATFKARTQYIAILSIKSGFGRDCAQTGGLPPCQTRYGPTRMYRFVVDTQ